VYKCMYSLLLAGVATDPRCICIQYASDQPLVLVLVIAFAFVLTSIHSRR